MQFSTVVLFAASALAASSTITETALSTQIETITSCGPEVTDCPANKGNGTITTASDNAANGAFGNYYAAGAAALAAGALLM